MNKLICFFLCTCAGVYLAACKPANKPEVSAPAAQTQSTVLDPQIKALEEAKRVGQTVQDAAQQRYEQIGGQNSAESPRDGSNK